MLLYLTSSANKTLKELVPFLPKPPQAMTVAFIPTAGDLYEDKPWQEADRERLKEIGFTVVDVDIKEIKGDVLRKKLEAVDVIFVAGGNTSYLLEQAQQSNFLEIARQLVRDGKIYIGSSAGSMLAGPNLELDKMYDDGEFGKELASYDALGLVDFVVLPHADNPAQEPYTKKVLERYNDICKLKLLNDNQALFVTDNETKLIEVGN